MTDVLAAQNHTHAIRLVKDLAFGKKAIAERDILGLHRAIMSGIISSAGEYRQGDVQIREASFTPPPAYMVQDLVRELVTFVGENPEELRPIELAAHVHYYMAWIHPFDDGNGRMARLLMNLILLRNSYAIAVVKKVDRKKYLETLDAVSGRGEFIPFLVFMARYAEQTIDLYLNAINRGNPKEKLLPLSQLAKSTPYSAEYLGLLARKGARWTRSKSAGSGRARARRWKHTLENEEPKKHDSELLLLIQRNPVHHGAGQDQEEGKEGARGPRPCARLPARDARL
jgi:Fic family protein